MYKRNNKMKARKSTGRLEEFLKRTGTTYRRIDGVLQIDIKYIDESDDRIVIITNSFNNY